MQSLPTPKTLNPAAIQSQSQAQDQPVPAERLQQVLAEARMAFMDFSALRQREDLERLTRLCFEALSYRRRRVEPYAYLAYAMFCIQAHGLSARYLKLARELSPDYYLVRLLQHQQQKMS